MKTILKIFDVVYGILLPVWQLPQFLAAIALILIFRPAVLPGYRGCVVFEYRLKRSCSLGLFIFMSKVHTEAQLAHEYGHSIQSLIFGPLYLLFIGLPSAVNIFESSRYYKVYPENWANRLGGVEVVETGSRSCDYELRLKVNNG